MSRAKFTDEFKRDAVAQVVDRGIPEQHRTTVTPVKWREPDHVLVQPDRSDPRLRSAKL